MRRTKLGLSRVIAIAVVTAVTVTVMSFYALWVVGVSTESGQGTRPIKLGLYNPFVIGNLVEVMIKNLGGDTVYINDITINNQECLPRLAFDSNNPKEYTMIYTNGKTLDDEPVAIKPGETVSLIFKTPITLKPGVTYEVRVRTTSGYTYVTYLEVTRVGNWQNYNLTYTFFSCLEHDGPSPTVVNGVRLYFCKNNGKINNVCKNVEDNKDIVSHGYAGYLVIFDVSTWRYEYYGVYNKDLENLDVTNPNNYLLIGGSDKGITGGSLTNPPPTYDLYISYAYTIIGSSPSTYINASDLVRYEGSNKIKIKSPIILYINLNSKVNSSLTIKQLNGKQYVFRIPPIPNAIPGFDFLILLQPDGFASLGYYTWPSWGSPPDLWVDYVMRVVWTKDGDVHVYIYRSISKYLNVFFIGLNFVYYKPACIELGKYPEDYISCSSSYYSVGPNGEKIYYPIGWDGGKCTITLSGYDVGEWVVHG